LDLSIFFELDKEDKLVIIISTHVDDSLIGGRMNHMEEFYKEFSKYLNIEQLDKLKNSWEYGGSG